MLGREVLRLAVEGAGDAGKPPAYGSVWATWHRHPPDRRWELASPRTGVQCQAVRLDISDAKAVTRLVNELQPQAVIHTAYSKEPETMERVTAGGSEHVARAAAAVGARLVHVSSDVVLDGEHGPYDESAPATPVHDYGRAKAAAEAIVENLCPTAAIVRTSLIMRLDPPDEINAWILDCLRQRRPITLFTDELRTPVWVQDLAAALLELAGACGNAPAFAGIINVAGPQSLSRYEIGVRIARHFGLDPAGIRAGRSRDSGLQRPRDCRLDTRLAQGLLRTRLRSFDQGLGQA